MYIITDKEDGRVEVVLQPKRQPVATALSLGAFGAGLAHGFCDAYGIDLAEGLEAALTFAPATLGALCTGGKFAWKGGLKGIFFGGIAGTVAGVVVGGPAGLKEAGLTALVGGAGGATAGGLVAAVGFGTVGAVYGGTLRALQTVAGYAGGYVVGMACR